jgi:hypothetical protein
MAQDQLAFEKRGENFALVRQRADGSRAEIELTTLNLIALTRLVPMQVRAVLAETDVARSGVAPTFAIPAQKATAGTDALVADVLLLIEDSVGSNLDYALTPTQARQLAHELTQSADTIETAAKQRPPKN